MSIVPFSCFLCLQCYLLAERPLATHAIRRALDLLSKKLLSYFTLLDVNTTTANISVRQKISCDFGKVSRRLGRVYRVVTSLAFKHPGPGVITESTP